MSRGDTPTQRSVREIRGSRIGYRGVSLDEDPKALQEMVSSKGMTWTQVWDADGAIVKLFNVKGTPTYYVLDRDGKIAAKRIPAPELSGAIINLLSQDRGVKTQRP